MQVLAHLDSKNRGNQFEATVTYKGEGAGAITYYFPSGLQGRGPVYSNPDDVLSVFQSFGWLRQDTDGKWVHVGQPLAEWTLKQGVDLYQ